MEQNVVLCGANSYDQKYYLNQEFSALPDAVKQELQIMCVWFTEDIGGILTLEFEPDGTLIMKTTADDMDYYYDDIGAGLKLHQLQRQKRELMSSLEMYYRVMFLNKTVEEAGKEILYPIALGPMAGVTDLPFRRLCREMGCGLLYTEMVSAKALSYHNKNTEPILETEDGEHPLAVQLFGSEPALLADMAKKLEEGPYDIIDLNMGCPVPKVVNNHEGSALMKDPILAGKVIEAMAKAVKKPVTVKIRRGWDESSVNAVEIARIAQESGAAAVAVHGRTRQQYYSGKADWEIIRQVKEAVKIPVIGNGDITDASSAKKMMEETGCDGIMVARAAKGNPWIFRELKESFEGQPISPRPTYKEVCQMILRHASMQIEYVGEHMGMLQMRKQVAWYTAGYPGSSKLRQEVNQITTYEELKSLLTRFAVSDIII